MRVDNENLQYAKEINFDELTKSQRQRTRGDPGGHGRGTMATVLAENSKSSKGKKEEKKK